MNSHFLFVLERPPASFPAQAHEFLALARIVEAHPALVPLLDFCAIDPAQIALAVGMVYAWEEDGQNDLAEIDFGQDDWFEPSAGLAVVQRALLAVRSDPASIAQAIYDPGLRAENVTLDLEALEQALLTAQQQETRFHFLQTP